MIINSSYEFNAFKNEKKPLKYDSIPWNISYYHNIKNVTDF